MMIDVKEELDKIFNDGKECMELVEKFTGIVHENNYSFEVVGLFIEAMHKSYLEEKEKRDK